MRMSFTRSGGLVAAPGLQVRASVDANESGGEVVAEPDYRRALDAAESTPLMHDAEQVARAHDGPAASAPGRDAFHFSFTIELPSGSTAEVDASAADVGRQSPELARLLRWASKEADTIVRRRATAKS